jgi:hypothetical protein
MSAIVHGWCGFVEKANEVVFQQMVLNKLWIPDVLIDIIKDYLYIDKATVLRNFYRFNLNRSITDLTTFAPGYMIDVYGRPRTTIWATGHVYGESLVQLQGKVCFTCGDLPQAHQNVNGCCTLVLDEEDEMLDLEYSDSYSAPEPIPEVSWAIDIPQPQEFMVYEEYPETTPMTLDEISFPDSSFGNGWDDYDIESQQEDYREYEKETRRQMYADRYF